jgi:hypothetical protein
MGEPFLVHGITREWLALAQQPTNVITNTTLPEERLEGVFGNSALPWHPKVQSAVAIPLLRTRQSPSSLPATLMVIVTW